MRRLYCRAALLLAFVLGPLAGCLATEREETVGVSLTGLDHLAEHLSIQDFWVNGTSGHQAGKGGSTVCCVSVPAKPAPGQKVQVRWGVTNWRDHTYSVHERLVPLERCDGPLEHLWVHFLADGSVRAIDCAIGPGVWEPNPEYPGPQPSTKTIPRKKPWQKYPRPEGMREFELVDDAMKEKP